MPDGDNDMPDIDENEIKYFRVHNPDNKKPDIVEESSNDDMPNIDENEIKYFRVHNPDNKKPDIVEESSNDDMPNIDIISITYFPTYNPTNSIPNIDHNQIKYFPTSSKQPKVKIPAELNLGLSKDNIKMPSKEESYLSEEKREELYKEILIYLIELRNNWIDLKNFLKSIWKEVDTRKSTVSELLRRIDVGQNQYNELQLNVTLYTLIYATFSTPDFSKLSDALATRFNKHIYTISKIVDETINGFSSIMNLDLYVLSLNDLENLEESDIIDDTEIEEEEFEEEYSYEKTEELFNEDDDIIPDEKQTFVINEMETLNINVPNFQVDVMEHIKKITNSIECTKEQKKIILSKSEEILSEHISRAENNEFTIPKNANLKIIAWAIIYTVINSDKAIPRISEKIPRDVYQYYHRYFSQFYPLDSVNSFPLKGIEFIARYIYQNLCNNNSEDYILRKLLDLDNLSTILNSKTKEYRSIRKRIDESKDSLINFFTDFIKVVVKIKELNDLGKDKEISLSKIGKELLENNISMGYTSDTFKEHILKVIFDSFLGLKGFTLRRLKRKLKKNYQERESKLILSDKQRTLFNRSILKKYSDDITQALFLLIKSEFESTYGNISPTRLANLIDFNRPLTIEILNFKTYIVLRLYSLHKIEKSILKNNELPDKKFIMSAIQEYIEILGIRYIFLYNIIEIFYKNIGRIINITDLARFFNLEKSHFTVFLNNKAENVFLNTILQLTLLIREIKAFNFRKTKLFHQDKFFDEEIFKIKDKIRDLKVSLIQECKGFILKYIYPNSEISEEIDLIINLINFVSTVEKRHISITFLSETIGLSEDTLTTRLRNSRYFKAIELRTIKNLINKNKKTYPEEVKESNLSLIRYINFRGVRLVSSPGYLQGWGDLFYEHCYHLVLDQLGCDLLDGDLFPIYFTEWLRHHFKFKKNSNELEDLVLTINKKHSEAYSHPSKPNRRNPDTQSKLLSRNKELIKKLIYSYLNNENNLKKIYTELPSSWKEINKKEFIKRLKFLKDEGKDRFFEEYYKAFYELNEDSIFWGTHIFK